MAQILEGWIDSVTAKSSQYRESGPRGRPQTSSPNLSDSIIVPAFELPFSVYASDQARLAFMAQLQDPLSWESDDIEVARKNIDEKYFEPLLKKALARYEVNIREQQIAGVVVDEVSPAKGIPPRNREKVLINLHGGAFTVGARTGACLESIPIASGAEVRVVSVDYRQGPEHSFPAASEDVASVYEALLQHYAPENIGIYGCSAGAVLTAMSIAFLDKKQLPLPAAIGLFFGGADATFGGESLYFAPALMGQQPPPPRPNPPAFPMAYMRGADSDDPLAYPIISREVLSRFPPTLMLSGTRAFDLSTVLITQSRLAQAGVATSLRVWESMWHAFFYDVDLPESQEAMDVIVEFFDGYLGAGSSKQ